MHACGSTVGLKPRGSGTLDEYKTLENLTTCSECIRLTLVVPKECRMDADILAGRVRELFNREVFKDLCHGCPLNNPQG